MCPERRHQEALSDPFPSRKLAISLPFSSAPLSTVFRRGPRALRHLGPSVRMMVVEIVAGKESGDTRCSRLLPGTMMKRSAPCLPSG